MNKVQASFPNDDKRYKEEVWDAYLANGQLAGIDLLRGRPIPDGYFHLVAHVLVRRQDNHFLLMQRAYTKKSNGGWFEASAQGSALKGEDALQCAKRELKEETGIIGGHWQWINQVIIGNALIVCYLCDVSFENVMEIHLQEKETIAYRWLNEEEFKKFVNSTEMIPSHRLRLYPFLIEQSYLKNRQD